MQQLAVENRLTILDVWYCDGTFSYVSGQDDLGGGGGGEGRESQWVVVVIRIQEVSPFGCPPQA